MRMFLVAGTLVLGSFAPALGAQQPAPALRIVVLEGEGGVNIIQQKTAVRPLIEVRDRNNVPVAGASVTFTIGGDGQSAAFAGGVQTLTVTTNAAGQAAASGLNAISSGALQIQVQAAYQGQIATAAISQTNFATAAAAAQAGAGAGAGAGGGGAASGAAGGAAGGGGGMSAATIGIVGAAVAGGAVAATQVAGKNDENETNAPFTGTLSGQLSYTSISTVVTCVRTQTLTGQIRITLNKENTSGTAEVQVTQTETSVTGSCNPGGTSNFAVPNIPVIVNGSAVTFNGNVVSGATTQTVKFDGTVSGSSITGTLGVDVVATGDGISTPRGNGSTSMQVQLRK